jgi:hypothetical protein
MGSLGEHAKGETPFLDRIRQLNAEYNAAAIKRANSCPKWRRLLYCLGFREQYFRWFRTNWWPYN